MGLPTPLARVLDAVQGAAPARVHQAPAVRWLSVPQLVRTAVDVLQASSFAKYADKRETMATSPREFYRLPAADEEPRDAVFVDYVADTGDGFNATFATARVLSGTADGALAPDPEFATRGPRPTCWCSAATRCTRWPRRCSTNSGSTRSCARRRSSTRWSTSRR